MNRALIIGPTQTKMINELIDYAFKNPFDIDILKQIAGGSIPPAGDDPSFVIQIPMGFRCVFTIEKSYTVTCRHLSVSVDAEEKYPSYEAVELIAELFGFKGKLEHENHIYTEPHANAVNIVGVVE